MTAWFNKRRMVLLLISFALAFFALKGLSFGTYCLVPSTFLKPDEVGTAEMSIHGIVLYREAGTKHMEMYYQAIWWYEVALFGIWAAAVALGACAYIIADRLWRNKPPTALLIGKNSSPPL